MAESIRHITLSSHEVSFESEGTRSDLNFGSDMPPHVHEFNCHDKEKIDFYHKVTSYNQMALEKMASDQAKKKITTLEFTNTEDAIKQFSTQLLGFNPTKSPKVKTVYDDPSQEDSLTFPPVAKKLKICSILDHGSKSLSKPSSENLSHVQLMDFCIPIYQKPEDCTYEENFKSKNFIFLDKLQFKQISRIEYTKGSYLNYFLTDNFIGYGPRNLVNFPHDILGKRFVNEGSAENRMRLATSVKKLKLRIEPIKHLKLSYEMIEKLQDTRPNIDFSFPTIGFVEKEMIQKSPHFVLTLQMHTGNPLFKTGIFSADVKLIGLVYNNDDFLMRRNSMNTDISNKNTVLHNIFSEDWVSFYATLIESLLSPECKFGRLGKNELVLQN